jgi:hypothetical protein
VVTEAANNPFQPNTEGRLNVVDIESQTYSTTAILTFRCDEARVLA